MPLVHSPLVGTIRFAPRPAIAEHGCWDDASLELALAGLAASGSSRPLGERVVPFSYGHWRVSWFSPDELCTVIPANLGQLTADLDAQYAALESHIAS